MFHIHRYMSLVSIPMFLLTLCSKGCIAIATMLPHVLIVQRFLTLSYCSISLYRGNLAFVDTHDPVVHIAHEFVNEMSIEQFHVISFSLLCLFVDSYSLHLTIRRSFQQFAPHAATLS
jgi:hypothetical protein